MFDDDTRDLATLGYDARWMEYGFLDRANLQLQIERYQASDDKNTEHYRYGAFQWVLHSRPALSDTKLGYYIELASLDTDPWIGRAALADLCGWQGLTREQWERLGWRPGVESPYLQKIIHRKRLRMELESGPLTEDLFACCLDFWDDSTHRLLLATQGLTEQQIQAISERATRAARNMARVKLRARAK